MSQRKFHKQPKIKIYFKNWPKLSLLSQVNCFKQLKDNPSITILKGKNFKILGRTDAEAETPMLWPPDVKNWLLWKDPDAGKDWRWEEKGKTEDETVGWHHWLNGHEFEQALGVGDGQGSLACCHPWGCKESYTPELLYWTEWVEARNAANRLQCMWHGPMFIINS